MATGFMLPGEDAHEHLSRRIIVRSVPWLGRPQVSTVVLHREDWSGTRIDMLRRMEALSVQHSTNAYCAEVLAHKVVGNCAHA